MNDVINTVQDLALKTGRLSERASAATARQTSPQLKDSAVARPTYRPDIDGLRAFAVGSVVFYHAFPHQLTGGYAGVDIFFVISGFLISSILFANLRHGTFSFADFYTRRARRIFPALITVLLPVSLFSWYIFTPDEFAMLGKQLAAGAGFVANIEYWREAGYFDTASDVKPLLHLWSLGVEEQFYIVWPVLLWGAWRVRANVLMLGVLLCAASFAINVNAIAAHPDGVFYLPVPRFWELLSGAALAYLVVVKATLDVGSLCARRGAAKAVNNVLATVGMALLVSTVTMLDTSLAFPGWWALAPVAGATMVLGAGPHALVNRFLLGNRLMVWFGLISYPLYLWHWPLLAFNRIFSPFLTSTLKVELMLAAVILAWLTCQFVEKHLRHQNHASSRKQAQRQVVGLYGVIAALCVSGIAICTGLIPARNTTRDVDALLAAQYDWAYPSRNFVRQRGAGPNVYTRAGTDPRYTLFIGDSVVEQFSPRIDRLLDEAKRPMYSVLFATGGGCPSVPEVVYVVAHSHPICEEVTKAAYETARRADVAKVVIGGSWERYLNAADADFAVHANGHLIRYGQPGAVDTAFAALEAQVAQLTKTKKVYILLSTPKDSRFSPKSMLTGSRWTYLARRRDTPAIDIGAFADSVRPIRERLRAIAARHGAYVIDPIASLCAGTICPVIASDGEPYFIDHEHMRPFYVRERATFLDETLLVD